MRVIFLSLVIVGQIGCSQSQQDISHAVSINFSDKVLTIIKDGQTRQHNVDNELISEVSELVTVINQVDYNNTQA